MKTKLSSSALWEDIVGYSRAIKVGNVIEIAGTASVKNGEVIHTPAGAGLLLVPDCIILKLPNSVIQTATDR